MVLKQLTSQTPVTSKAQYTARTFGIERLACMSPSVDSRLKKFLSRGYCEGIQVAPKGCSGGWKLWLQYPTCPFRGTSIFGMDFYVVMDSPDA
ncbi:hypothetical protein GYMLUDRAFT_1000571 [Collybiopsis luxurians FD-317 M1]|uniref:Uncharacterized protein n=1 Tax=Collybiopsis luxurians FD-317 M1 TaxID=944289 RepID=A0A0D0CC06_9AGAR|nr:hypothetical protein GYMLUDRAFT_1000571 [Collybiopsis luxurians FD-317 M1]